MAGKAGKAVGKRPRAKTEVPASSNALRLMSMQALAAPALVVALTLFQGGYYAGATCVIAIIALIVFVVAAVLRKKEVACRWYTILLLAMGCVYLVSALAHEVALSMLQETCVWFALAGMSLWCVPSTVKEHDKMLEYISLAGAVLAAIGILMFAGIAPLEGAVSAGRLMFTFQYANAAGVFFAVSSVICLCSKRRKYRIVSLVPIVALLLTQSMGAIMVFLAALVPIAIRWAKGRGLSRKAIAFAAAGLAVVIAVACVLLQGRIAQASGTFAERIVQMLDALSLLVGNVALGVGPDQWQFLYPAVQSAQYRAADVHCSYLQVALDAGLPALALLLSLVIGGVIGLVRQRAFAPSLAAGMMCVHAVFDFDFQFAALTLLFIVLIARPAVETRLRLSGGRLQSALCWGALACSLAASCAGVYLDLQMGEVQGALARGEAQQALSIAREKPCLADDAAVQVLVCEGLLQSGDNQAVIEESSQLNASNASTGLCRAIAQQRLGTDEDARQTLSDVLAANPYDVELLEALRDYIVDSNLGDDYIDLYNEAAAASNARSQEGHAAWLPNQKQVESIDSGAEKA